MNQMQNVLTWTSASRHVVMLQLCHGPPRPPHAHGLRSPEPLSSPNAVLSLVESSTSDCEDHCRPDQHSAQKFWPISAEKKKEKMLLEKHVNVTKKKRHNCRCALRVFEADECDGDFPLSNKEREGERERVSEQETGRGRRGGA